MAQSCAEGGRGYPGSSRWSIANIVGILVLVVAMLVLLVRRSAPSTIAAWHSPIATWIGRTLLAVTAFISGANLVRDTFEILS